MVGWVGINGNDVRHVALALFSCICPYITFITLFDPLNGLVKSIANWNLEARVPNILDISVRWVIEGFLILRDVGSEPVNLLAKSMVGDSVGILLLLKHIGKSVADGLQGDCIDALVPVEDGFNGVQGHLVIRVDCVGVDEHQAGGLAGQNADRR